MVCYLHEDKDELRKNILEKIEHSRFNLLVVQTTTSDEQ